VKRLIEMLVDLIKRAEKDELKLAHSSASAVPASSARRHDRSCGQNLPVTGK